MIDFGWMRLAHLLIVLSVLGALVQLGTPTAAPLPLAAEPPDERAAAEDPPAHEASPPRPRAAPRENPSTPTFARHLHEATGVGQGAADPETDPAVFYRPAPKDQADLGSDPGGPSRPAPVCGDLGRFPSGHRLVFPLPMKYASSFEDTWGAPRPQGGHEGTDLMSPTGTPEYAVTDGTVVPVTGSNGNGWNTLGGYTVMLRAAYSVGPVREGDLFYYAHLDRESALPLGTTVRAGQVVGYAGDTGQGPQVTRGLFPPHLHFGWYDATGTRSYLPSGAMNPFPLLEWMVATGGVLGGGSNARYCEVPRSGAPIPSRGPDHWPAASDAGSRPDLDTGTDRPVPGPVAPDTARTHEPPIHEVDNPGRANPSHPRAPSDPPARAAPHPHAPETSKPGKPAARGEPSPSATETDHRPGGQSTGEDPRAPDSHPGNEPPHAGHPGTGEESQDGRETGKGEDADKEPAGDAEGHGPQAGDDEPAAEKPEDGTTRPGEETTPDDSASETEGAETTDTGTDDPEGSEDQGSEDQGSEDQGSEAPGSEPPQETTTAE